MQCPCGASAPSKSSVLSKFDAELTYWECQACTRASAEFLKVAGVIVARGREAQGIFNGDLEGFVAAMQSNQQGSLF